MGVTTRERKYGNFEWISVADSDQSKDEITQREKERQMTPEELEARRAANRKAVAKHRSKERRKQATRDLRTLKRHIKLGKVETPPDMDQVGKERNAKKAGLSWHTIQRNRWRNLCIQCKKQKIDAPPWDAYKALWEAAGTVVPPWGGNPIEAGKLQDHHFSTRMRCLMVRFDTESKESGKEGFKPGNTGVVLVEGHYRNPKKLDAEPSLYKELAVWAASGDILDRNGQVVGHVDR